MELKEAVLQGFVELFVTGSNRALVYLAEVQHEGKYCYGILGKECGLEYRFNYFANPFIQEYMKRALIRIPNNEKIFALLDSNYRRVWQYFRQSTELCYGKSEQRLEELIERIVKGTQLPKEKSWWVLPTRLYPNLKVGDYIGRDGIDIYKSYHKCDELRMEWPVGYTDFSQPVNIFGLIEEIVPFNSDDTIRTQDSEFDSLKRIFNI